MRDDDDMAADHSNVHLVEAIDDVMLQTLSLARDLTEADADLPTDCPGWTVRDVLAHMVGVEAVLQGAPQPAVDLPVLDHVVNEFDEYMEQHVQIRRQLPLSSIADELAGLRSRRIPTLKSLAKQGDPEVSSPFRDQPMSKAMPIRVFDLWAHEQDIRRAVGLPARVDCAAAEISMERGLLGWTHVIPKLLDQPATVSIDVAGRPDLSTEFEVDGGGDEVAIRGDLATLTALFCGRGEQPSGVVTGADALVAALDGRLGLTP